MSIEYTLSRTESTLVKFPEATANLTQARRWWTLVQLVLAGLLLSYIVGAIQDVQRVRDLRAEPSSLARIIVITKNEAWQRIYPRPTRPTAAEDFEVSLRPSTATP